MKKIFKIINFVIILELFFCVSTFALLIPKKYMPKEEENTLEVIDNVEIEALEEKVPTIDDVILRDVQVGDIVTFGRFYDMKMEDEVEKVPIKWKVLDKIGDSALLISNDILKTMPYNANWNVTTWKDSSLRSWLNNDFLDIAFNDLEKELIDKVIIKNNGNTYTNVVENYITRDDVFILNIEEAHKYFGKDSTLMAVGTEYAKKEGLWLSTYATSRGYSVWWLRNPGKSLSFVSIVHAGGTIGTAGDGVATRGNGVRPCIWVKTK